MRSSALSPGRKPAHHLAADLAQAMAATGTAEPDLAAALAVAAWRTIHLLAIRAILAGEDPQRLRQGTQAGSARRSARSTR
jgi:hypothetical protein